MSDFKRRIEVPRSLAAVALFAADRTCCVCREPGRPVQIHHIDSDPSNNDLVNLAVMCIDCHNDTMLGGGFGRHLDAHQVTLYRDNWDALVSSRRTLSNGPCRRPTSDPAMAFEDCEDVVVDRVTFKGFGNPIVARRSRNVKLGRIAFHREEN